MFYFITISSRKHIARNKLSRDQTGVAHNEPETNWGQRAQFLISLARGGNVIHTCQGNYNKHIEDFIDLDFACMDALPVMCCNF